MNLLFGDIFSPDIAIEIVLVKGVQSLYYDDVYFSGEVFAADDLNPKVLVRLGAVKFSQRNNVRSVKLPYQGFHDIFLVNNRSLPVEGQSGGDHRRDYRESGGEPFAANRMLFVLEMVPH